MEGRYDQKDFSIQYDNVFSMTKGTKLCMAYCAQKIFGQNKILMFFSNNSLKKIKMLNYEMSCMSLSLDIKWMGSVNGKKGLSFENTGSNSQKSLISFV